MGKCKPMCGFDVKETENLRARYRKIKDDCEWTSVEDFLNWSKKNGYRTGMHLSKRDGELPHGPLNSVFQIKGLKKAKRLFIENMKKSCEFCKDCQKECPLTGRGCQEWADQWKQNWNKNIHVPPVKPLVEEGPMVWRYEHPDLVREGIVFEASR